MYNPCEECKHKTELKDFCNNCTCTIVAKSLNSVIEDQRKIIESLKGRIESHKLARDIIITATKQID